ncbi:MAG: TPD domain-containing protein [Candidatus Helarchaeota archaeon]
MCQKIVEDTKKNYWKLKKYNLTTKTNILSLSKQIKVAPVLIIREILKRRNYSRNEINDILRDEFSNPSDLKEKIKLACLNDPVYSPLGVEYARKRGEEGEDIINSWLLSKNLHFKRDLGNGVSHPDFLLEKPIKIFNKEIIWIESKCYFGGKKELIDDEPQFKRFDPLGDGVIVYWFGYDKSSKRYFISGEEIIKLLPDSLKIRVRELLDFIPPEFLHLIK